MDVNKEEIFFKEIENIENGQNINYEMLEEIKADLLALRQKKMDEIHVRSKAKWIQEGENLQDTFAI